MSEAPISQYVDVSAVPWQERHSRLGAEQIFVLEGSVSDDTGTCTAGNR